MAHQTVLHRHRCHGMSNGREGGNHKDLRSMKSGGVSDNLCPISFLSMVSGIKDFKGMPQHQFCLWCQLQMGNTQTDSVLPVSIRLLVVSPALTYLPLQRC